MKNIVGVIVGIGLLHRLLFLGTRQLWTDELMQARIIRFASPAEIVGRLRGGMDLASPLDFFVQRGVTVLLGDSTWALRLHAVLFGTLSIWVFYRLSRFLFGDRVAAYSTVLFAFFPLSYHYSQEGRPYALLLFLTLLSYDLLVRQLYGGRRGWHGWALIACVLALLLYTSFLGGLILLSQFAALVLTALWRKRPVPAPGEGESEPGPADCPGARWIQVVAYMLAALVAALLFYPWADYAWARPRLASASEILSPKLILRIIKELGDGSYPVAGLLLIGVVTGIRALRRHGRRNSLAWLLCWFLVPIPVLLLVEVWAGYFFAIRHILHATPPLLLIAGYGLSYVGERLTILPRLPYQLSSPALTFAALLVLACAWIGQSHARSDPADWAGTAAYLSQTVREGDAVAAPMVYALLEYYYPGLEPHLTHDLDPGPGTLASGGVQRRFVVCYEKISPDPCRDFRASALKDGAWSREQFKAFTVFVRSK
jgi:hypothetical protein